MENSKTLVNDVKRRPKVYIGRNSVAEAKQIKMKN
jgi:hypothetical protein